MNSNTRPKVSVCVTTHNHEYFILKSLESIFNQKTSFIYEVIICNDASIDNTDTLIKEFIADKSNIKYFNHQENLGISKNFKFSLEQATGEYVAVFDGDDYWTDPYKLQVQVDYLEKNRSYSSCFTDTDILLGNTIQKNALKNKHKRNITFETVNGHMWIPTTTFMYRNSIFQNNLPDSFNEITMVDIFLFHLALEKGSIGYIDSSTAIYRKHENGIWSGLNRVDMFNFRVKNYKKMYKHFKNNLLFKRKFFNQTIGNSKKLIYQLIKNRDIKFVFCFLKLIVFKLLKK